MELKDLKPSIWEDISGKKTKNEKTARIEQLIDNECYNYYTGIFTSADGSLHLIIEQETPLSEELVNPKAAGIKLGILRNHWVEGRERQDYFDLKCTARQHQEAYTELVRQISRTILYDGIKPSKAINLTIKRWKKFWGKPGEECMTEYDQMGLIGELLVLKKLIDSGVNDPISRWAGPCGGIHDFEFDTSSLEVKTTLRSRHQHIINGLEQLESQENKKLVVVSHLFQKINSEGLSLSRSVNDLIKYFGEYPDQLEMFNERLLLMGYRPDHEIYYDHLNFRLLDTLIFPVDENFPKMTTSSLVAPLSPRITNIKYIVDCEGLESFSYDNTQFRTLLK